MSGNLLVTDCDEVLLHMVRHFGDWLGEAHAIDFRPDGGEFAQSMRRRACGTLVEAEAMWSLLDGFFETEMPRQTLVPGAADALARIGAVAEIVVLTNLADRHQAARAAQLAALGLPLRVLCNQGGKGRAVAALVADAGANVAVFVDDLPVHHRSVAGAAPRVHCLHMVADADQAARIADAPDAHARIDDWPAAADWILARFAAGRPAGA